MRTRWFGEPWPSAELRAPVCEDDTLRVPVPLGYHCQHCIRAFADDDQGIVMAYTGPIVDDIVFTVAVDDGTPLAHSQLVVAAHLECFLRSILGPAAALR